MLAPKPPRPLLCSLTDVRVRQPAHGRLAWKRTTDVEVTRDRRRCPSEDIAGADTRTPDKDRYRVREDAQGPARGPIEVRSAGTQTEPMGSTSEVLGASPPASPSAGTFPRAMRRE
jgi:hypothetical protein